MEDVKLNHEYTFWVQQIQRGKTQDYGSNLKPVTTVQTAKQFWEVFQFLKKSNDLDKGKLSSLQQLLDCDLYLFKRGIKPQWQDPGNVGGGCFKIKIDKKKSNKLWQNAVLSIVNPNNTLVKTLNGVRIKIKQKFDEIEIWMSSQSLQKMNQVKIYLKQHLQVTDDKVYAFIPFK